MTCEVWCMQGDAWMMHAGGCMDDAWMKHACRRLCRVHAWVHDDAECSTMCPPTYLQVHFGRRGAQSAKQKQRQPGHAHSPVQLLPCLHFPRPPRDLCPRPFAALPRPNPAEQARLCHHKAGRQAGSNTPCPVTTRQAGRQASRQAGHERETAAALLAPVHDSPLPHTSGLGLQGQAFVEPAGVRALCGRYRCCPCSGSGSGGASGGGGTPPKASLRLTGLLELNCNCVCSGAAAPGGGGFTDAQPQLGSKTAT